MVGVWDSYLGTLVEGLVSGTPMWVTLVEGLVSGTV